MMTFTRAEVSMERERAKSGDIVRPIGWHHKMLVIRTTPANSGVSEDDEALCRWTDKGGEHQQVFKAVQLEILGTIAGS